MWALEYIFIMIDFPTSEIKLIKLSVLYYELPLLKQRAFGRAPRFTFSAMSTVVCKFNLDFQHPLKVSFLFSDF